MQGDVHPILDPARLHWNELLMDRYLSNLYDIFIIQGGMCILYAVLYVQLCMLSAYMIQSEVKSG